MNLSPVAARRGPAQTPREILGTPQPINTHRSSRGQPPRLRRESCRHCSQEPKTNRMRQESARYRELVMAADWLRYRSFGRFPRLATTLTPGERYPVAGVFRHRVRAGPYLYPETPR